MEQQYFSQFVNAFMGLIIPVLATALVGVSIQGFRWLAAKIKQEQPDVYAQLEFFARAGVLAAEQAKIGELGQVKLDYAVDFVQTWLNKYGYKDIDVKTIESVIEKSVFEEFNKEWNTPV